MRRWQAVVSGAALLLAAFSLLTSVFLFTKLGREARERRDQACLIDERQQHKDVVELKKRYRYLLGQPRARLHEPGTIERAVYLDLPSVERDAREDNAAPFCDEPGVGLPEPDDKVPKRPAALRAP